MLNTERTREHLRTCNLNTLFTEELGWDHHDQALSIPVDGETFTLNAIAQKRGMVALFLDCANGDLPDYPTRRKIEHKVAKSIHEHLIIYVDGQRMTQIWQWVKRQSGKPAVCREQRYYSQQSGEALIQRLRTIAFTLEEEESLTLPDVTGRTRAAFDVDRVTKRFYDRFKTEHAAFLKFLKGIPDEEMQRWYASVMINRLMFIYFIQKKEFLDGDPKYLRNRLNQSKSTGKDRYYTHFLCPLFFEGFAKKESERRAGTNELLGKIPYLNGGIFQRHQVEELHGRTIGIADAAFETLFEFFDQYHWHLDERPLRSDNEINPDVLGYIFEKYINQKQMGAYYTKEDITGYISQNTVIPRLFDMAKPKCRIAFEETNGGSPDTTIWGILQAEPDRCIYDAVRKGIGLPLPKDIAEGLNDVSHRTGWNRPAPPEYALPTEIWREVVARRRRYEEVRGKLVDGRVRDINDVITCNLDIRQFAQDVIEGAEGPELLRSFWHAIRQITILDPTCGSGAFLFAALNILEPLYEACLDRMEFFLDELDRSGEEHRPEKFSDFRQVLAQVAKHPNERYFILKSIILNNLFGVDIMEEAVEICKLRLFLKLVAQVEQVEDIEPLPDIDFNIRAGNTLVGFVNRDEIKKAMTLAQDGRMKMLFAEDTETMRRVDENAEDIERRFDLFRQMQTQHGMNSREFLDAKQQLRKRLEALGSELNSYLATEYGTDPSKKKAFEHWLATHRPFHWFIEFYGILESGGFDTIIGNPPFVVYSPAKVNYEVRESLFKTYQTKNLYAYVFERSLLLGKHTSQIGLIVQLTALSAEKMDALQDALLDRGVLRAIPFPRRPESMFDGVEMPIGIMLLSCDYPKGMLTTRISRFYTEERPSAMNLLSFQQHEIRLGTHRIAKMGNQVAVNIFNKLNRQSQPLETLITASSNQILYYQEACRYWVKACKGYPFFKRNGKAVPPPHGRVISFLTSDASSFAACLLNSSLFYWFYSAFSDCEHVNDSLVRGFKIGHDWSEYGWNDLWSALSQDLEASATRKVIHTKQGHKIEYMEMNAAKSKPIIDEIDQVLAKHYGFTDEELDFIINYDIKYRMGADALLGEDEDE